MNSKIVLICSIIMILFVCSNCYAKEFSDVPSTSWAYEYINKLSDDGIINGYSDGTFKPKGNVTRAEFIKLMVVSTYGENIIKLLSDRMVFQKWYDSYAWIAYQENRFTKEYSVGDLDAPLTRREMIILLGNFKQLSLDEEDHLTENFKFNDFNSKDLMEEDRNSANIAYNLNFVKGYEDGGFKPDNNITRAEVATVVYRFIEGE